MYLLMNDDGTVTPLTRCDDCGFLFVDIDKHVAESVTVPAYESYTSQQADIINRTGA